MDSSLGYIEITVSDLDTGRIDTHFQVKPTRGSVEVFCNFVEDLASNAQN